MKLKLIFTVDAERAMTHGVEAVTSGLRLTPDGKIVIPIDSGQWVINNPAPCGTWELVNE